MDQCTLGAARIAGLNSRHVAKQKNFLRDNIIIISSAAKLVGDSHNYMRRRRSQRHIHPLELGRPAGLGWTRFEKVRAMAPEIRDPKASELAKAISRAAGEGIASVEAAVLSECFADIEPQKGKASGGELLSIADQTATYVTRPDIDHGSLLYDETDLPVSDEPPFNPTTVLSKVRELGLQTPDEATGIVREHRDRR